MRIQRAELRFLPYRALQLSRLLTASHCHEFPRENLAVYEKVIIQNAGRRGKKKGLFLRFVLGRFARTLYQELIIRRYNRLRLSRADFFPFITSIAEIQNKWCKDLPG